MIIMGIKSALGKIFKVHRHFTSDLALSALTQLIFGQFGSL